MLPSLGSPALRLSAFYAAFFMVIGTIQPFWPLWLAGQRLSPAEIGSALAIGVGAKIVGLPVAAHFADRLGERRRPMLVLSAASTLAFALFAGAHAFSAIVLVSLLFFSLWPPVMSLGESVTVAAARTGGLEYGRIRLWGSLSFIVTALGAGAMLARVPTDAVFWMILAGCAVTTLTCAGIPDVRPARSRSTRLPIVEALSSRSLVQMLVACGLIQGSHAVYYAFATLHWRAAGWSETVIGALWAEGVVCEVVLFAFGVRAIRACGAARLIVLAGAAAALRWLATGLGAELPLLVVLQTLHAATYGAAHLGAMHWIGHHVEPGLSATAQSLYSAIVFGLFLGGLLWAAGVLYADLGGRAFLPMAGVALAGCLIAVPLLARDREEPVVTGGRSTPETD